VRVLTFATRDASRFATLGGALLAEAKASGEVHFAASAITGPAVLLGAAQRTERVLDLDACARDHVTLVRRATSGTAMFVGEAAFGCTLALPRVNALAPDTTLRTLVNRNVRGFLKGLTALGALAHYFGREWIAVQHRPIALIGTTHDEDGAALVDVVVALDSPVALPSTIAAPLERALDRYRGKQPITLHEATSKRMRIDEAAERFVAAFASRYGAAVAPAHSVHDAPARSDGGPPMEFTVHSAVPCAIGYVDAASSRDRDALWLGGDAWAPPHVLRAISDAIRTDTADTLVLPDGALEGARVEDFVRAAHAVRGDRA
jgi:lipoate-protein ligase A